MIAVIDIAGNNLKSLTNAIRQLGDDCLLTHCRQDIQKASHIILPGVGAAGVAMKALQRSGLIDALLHCTKPILGICLGMQLLFEHSEEGDVSCLGLIPGEIKPLPASKHYPVPHMGWNRLVWTQDSPLGQGISDKDYFYFVHSYALMKDDFALATCQYSEPFAAIVQHRNIFGMQFHPEKSAEPGLQLLRNFLKLGETC
ncbi:imidazole glycerol phosphate synthase subunit HisH [Legionella jordanis]|uniref:Imidazole glycerol phosphate synthase subunit HisH n=1 Tax=Legionella jordanis TaxID=456 RepID=A0A0W0VA44_9GAMM|nr:imidazole glycerol phosphate synthase subunit HisH [Legionella jordanis]KTD16970.1 imidazole glycerol phosphate synthase subunit HisH [Legionella jordanis]RMX03111.1 imidazole glycerol phosphate synthase subunit HisH [Legionella jordanis]RMX18750.1 imidazole glycerol phosphate synthase subunit HisH [Legionella jordanis]VEH12836.1 glutamine amidotransferase [Legionella jordanis]HAT8713021.1 imidazole glycerol phosphate synthase subunit HisH [Legionella jordanis]